MRLISKKLHRSIFGTRDLFQVNAKTLDINKYFLGLGYIYHDPVLFLHNEMLKELSVCIRE